MNCSLCSASVVIRPFLYCLVIFERSIENVFVFCFDCERLCPFVNFRFAKVYTFICLSYIIVSVYTYLFVLYYQIKVRLINGMNSRLFEFVVVLRRTGGNWGLEKDRCVLKGLLKLPLSVASFLVLGVVLAW